jgi:DNA-binding SARP family transcriptional activator/tetratricopeptide (TPR) repeat protein
VTATAGDGLAFGVLGPVQVQLGIDQVTLSGKQRSLLAVLLLNANQVMGTRQLAEAVWGHPLPAAPDTRIRSLVSELRRALTAHHVLVTQVPGYLLRVEPGQFDLDRFRQRVDEAREAVAGGQPEVAVARYDEALALWRGKALGGVSGPYLDTQAARMEELRLSVVEERTETMLTLGRHVELIPELGQVIAEHPLRERPHTQLMVALYRGGRRSEALDVYRCLRECLINELGLEPTPELQLLHQQMLAGDLALDHVSRPASARRPPVPTRQLPADTARFVGRNAELERLDEFGGGPDRLMLVVGAAGAGKTTLVLRWAHGAAARFPDGQLFLDMRGFERGPRVVATDVLPQLLQALGVPVDDIPVGQDAQTALYRSTLAGRRFLVVLDNVAAPEQVRPLLPGDPGCLVVVTSRDRLGGLVALDGARRLTLEVMPPADAVDVLAQTAGADLVDADHDAAVELAQLCGHLPLALRIAAGRLADQPQGGIRRHVEELARHGRMAGLRMMGDERATVRGAFDLSYQALPRPAQRMFRQLGLATVPAGWSVHAAAALGSIPVVEAEGLLDTLARLHLIKPTAVGRYECHDLLLEYAAELAVEDPAGQRKAATRRLFDFYLHTTDHAGVSTFPAASRLPRGAPADGVVPIEFTEATPAREWVATEWDNLVAGVHYAAARGPRSMAWHLVDALRSHLYLAASRPEWLAIAEVGLACAVQERDALGEAATRFCLGFLRQRMAEYPASIDELERAIALYRQAGFRSGESAALRSLGVSLATLGRLGESLDRFNQALAIDRAIGNQHGEAANLNNIAYTHQELGDLTETARHLTIAIPLLHRLGRRAGEAIALSNLGALRRNQGQLDEARVALDRALAICREAGLRHEEAVALTGMGEVHRDAGRYREAASMLITALDIAERAGNLRLQTLALNALASVDTKLGRPADAVTRLRSALDIIAQTGHKRGHVEALIILAEAHCALDQRRSAHEHACRALALARESGYVIEVAAAHTALAQACFGLGLLDECLNHARQALQIQQQAGQRLAQERTESIIRQAANIRTVRD